MENEQYNQGLYADRNIAQSWIWWVEKLHQETRDQEVYPWLSQWIAQHKPKRILEIGSGQGICSEKVEFHGAQYAGVEPSAHLRARAHELYPARDFRAGRAEQLPFDDATFDAAFSVFVWLHVEDPDVAAAELARVLAPGGAFAIVTANPDMYHAWLSWQTNIVGEGKKVTGDFKELSRHVMYLHTMGDLEKSFANHGLALTDRFFCGRDEDAQQDPGFAVILSGYKL